MLLRSSHKQRRKYLELALASDSFKLPPFFVEATGGANIKGRSGGFFLGMELVLKAQALA